MTATVRVRRPGGTGGVFDPATGTREVVPFPPHFEGKARIQIRPVTSGEDTGAGQEVTSYSYLVAVPEMGSGGCKVDDLVDVVAVDGNGDASLVGRSLACVGVMRGSLTWERDLYCIDDLG